jgi:chorismate-pyruvate lyase
MALNGASRRRYKEGLSPGNPAAVWADAWLRILLAQDGSATLICETIAQGPVRLDVMHQVVTGNVPPDVKIHLSGEEFIERHVCISFRDEVMMDNLSYIALDTIDPELRGYLEAGISPIGHIFDRRWTRKKPLPSLASVQRRLWERSGQPDPSAVRSYLLEMPHGTCMLITETFRAGMRFGLPVVSESVALVD